MSGMRGGPRLMCSPYLTGALALMLVLVGFNYWSLSTQNQDLLVKTSDMQQQLRIGSDRVQEIETNYSNLKHEHTIVTDEKSQCHTEKKKLDETCENEKTSKDSEISRLGQKNEDLLEEIKKLKIECEENSDKEIQLAEEKETMMRDREDLIKAKEDLEAQVETLKNSLAEAESKSADLQGKLSELLNRNVQVPQMPQISPAQNLSNGQLPDVNPDAVSVIKKDTLGMNFHKDERGRYMPIIVRGDPNKPRAKPRYSLDQPPPKHRTKHSLSPGPPGINIPPADPQPAPGGISTPGTNDQPQEESIAQIPLPNDEKPAENNSEPKTGEENVTTLMENALNNKEGGDTGPQSVKDSAEEPIEKVEGDHGEVDKNEEDIEDLDRQEADSFIPQLENSKEGRKEIQNDDQDPAGDIEESENPQDEEENIHADLQEVDKMKGDKGIEEEDDSQMENEDYDGLKKLNSDIEVL